MCACTRACAWAGVCQQAEAQLAEGRDDTELQASLCHPATLVAHKTAAEMLAERVSNEVASRQKHGQQAGEHASQSRAVSPERMPQPFVLRMGANRIKSESKPRASCVQAFHKGHEIARRRLKLSPRKKTSAPTQSTSTPSPEIRRKDAHARRLASGVSPWSPIHWVPAPSSPPSWLVGGQDVSARASARGKKSPEVSGAAPIRGNRLRDIEY